MIFLFPRWDMLIPWRISDTYLQKWLVFLTYLFQPTHVPQGVQRMEGLRLQRMGRGGEPCGFGPQNSWPFHAWLPKMKRAVVKHCQNPYGHVAHRLWDFLLRLTIYCMYICTVDTRMSIFWSLSLFDHCLKLTTWLQDTSLVVSCYEGLPAEFKAVVLCFPQCRQTPKWEVPHLKHHRHRKKVPVVSKEVMYGSLSVFFFSGVAVDEARMDQVTNVNEEYDSIWFSYIQL